MFANTGVLVMAISVFGLFWHTQTKECKKLINLYELSHYMKKEINNFEADQKMENLKKHYQRKGIIAKEDYTE